jgi:dTDP-4-dehydrorhamnose 3,5-epimerase-like enzyme
VTISHTSLPGVVLIESELHGDERGLFLETFPSIVADGEQVDFSKGFNGLHTRVYARTLSGEGFGISNAQLSIETAHHLRAA